MVLYQRFDLRGDRGAIEAHHEKLAELPVGIYAWSAAVSTLSPDTWRPTCRSHPTLAEGRHSESPCTFGVDHGSGMRPRGTGPRGRRQIRSWWELRKVPRCKALYGEVDIGG